MFYFLFENLCFNNYVCAVEAFNPLSLDSSDNYITIVWLTQPCVPPGSLSRVPALIKWGNGGNVTSRVWQITLCAPTWRRSVFANFSTPFTYLLTNYCLHIRGIYNCIKLQTAGRTVIKYWKTFNDQFTRFSTESPLTFDVVKGYFITATSTLRTQWNFANFAWQNVTSSTCCVVFGENEPKLSDDLSIEHDWSTICRLKITFLPVDGGRRRRRTANSRRFVLHLARSLACFCRRTATACMTKLSGMRAVRNTKHAVYVGELQCNRDDDTF